MNRKQVIRINENQLRQIVMESVKRVLNETMSPQDLWKSQAKSMMRGMERELDNNNIEQFLSYYGGLQVWVNKFRQSMQQPTQQQFQIQQQPIQPQQQSMQQPTQQQSQVQQQPMQKQTQGIPRRQQQSANNNNDTMVDNQVQQQMQRNMALQQQKADRIRQQKIGK